MGGLAIALAAVASAGLVISVIPVGDASRWGLLLVAGAVILGVGVADDLFGLRPRHKLLAQILAAAVLCTNGVRVDSILWGGEVVLELGWLATPITMIWRR